MLPRNGKDENHQFESKSRSRIKFKYWTMEDKLAAGNGKTEKSR